MADSDKTPKIDPAEVEILIESRSEIGTGSGSNCSEISRFRDDTIPEAHAG